MTFSVDGINKNIFDILPATCFHPLHQLLFCFRREVVHQRFFHSKNQFMRKLNYSENGPNNAEASFKDSPPISLHLQTKKQTIYKPLPSLSEFLLAINHPKQNFMFIAKNCNP